MSIPHSPGLDAPIRTVSQAAEDMGWAACQRGHPVSACRFKPDTPEHAAWMAGYETKDKEMSGA